MTKRNANANARTFPLPLKSLHDDIMRDVPNATITTKKMRVKLRVAMRDEHSHNQSWMIANAKDYDRVRSLFDPAYATKIAKVVKPRAKRVAKTNVDANVEA